MEDRAIERLTDLYDYWMPQVSDTTTYPIDCVFTADELETIVRYKPANNTVRIDRSHCGFPHDIVNVREFLVSPSNGVLKMRVILDRHSMELFINDGEQAASSLIYTHDGAQAISFEADGDVLLDVEKYSLNL